MLPFELTSLAKQDLKKIARYTMTKWGKKQSLDYAGLLENRFREIADGKAYTRAFPKRFSASPGQPVLTPLHFLYSL